MMKNKEKNAPIRPNKWKRMDAIFRDNYVMYQDHLQHATQLMILLNITLFFLTELVTKHGYYYTFISLGMLGCVQLALVMPFGFMRTLKSYCIFLLIEAIGVYFFLSSVVYWIVTNRS